MQMAIKQKYTHCIFFSRWASGLSPYWGSCFPILHLPLQTVFGCLQNFGYILQVE